MTVMTSIISFIRSIRGLSNSEDAPRWTLRVHDGQRVSQARGRGSDQLEVEFRQVGPGPAHLSEPAGDPLLAGRGQCVHLAVRPVRQSGRLLRCHQARLLQPGQRDVDLPVVHRVPERAERLPQPRARDGQSHWY